MTDRDPSAALDRLVHEAKQELEPRIAAATWAAMEERLVARMSAERLTMADEADEAGVPSLHARRRVRVFQLAASALAVAAAIAIVVRNGPGAAVVDGSVRSQLEVSAGSLRATEGPGEVRIAGSASRAGQVLHVGDLVEADGARAVLERPGKVTWLLERVAPEATEVSGSAVARVRVRSAGESLIVGLLDGAIEAQVTPVPAGEAFAIDVATPMTVVRVAVHGTHLRVSRVGTRVVVDLTEGVVSIGVPPRWGSTYGTLVTAPSHVEFDAANLEGTLKVDHAPAAVRSAVLLVPHDVAVHGDSAGPTAAADDRAAAIGPAPVARPPASDQAASIQAPDPLRTEPARTAKPGKPALSAREAVAMAVRDCAAARQRPDNVRATVTSSLKLTIGAGGRVESAQFDPPLLPQIQACAAKAIYEARIEQPAGGIVILPIDFTY